MNNHSLYGFLLVTAMMVTTAACSHKKSSTEEGELTVSVAVPEIDSITLYKTYPGYASAQASADVVGRVNGQLLSKNYDSGSLVQKGAVLFTIEPVKYNDAVRQAQAALATAESEYEYASKQCQAMKKAFESDAVSRMEVIQAESDMQQAEAAIKNARAALSTANTNLAYCTVRAPFTGHITSSTVDVGNYINGEGASFKLATIYDDSSLIVSFAIEDSQYERMMGAGVNPEIKELYRAIPLQFEESLPHSYTADLYYTSPSIDKKTGTLTLKVKVDNPYGELRDGMYVTVNLPYDNDSHAMLVRDASIGTDQLGKYLYVVNDSDKVVYTPIEVGGLYRDSMRVVTKGISPESHYITSALLKVRDGMPVKTVMTK